MLRKACRRVVAAPGHVDGAAVDDGLDRHHGRVGVGGDGEGGRSFVAGAVGGDDLGRAVEGVVFVKDVGVALAGAGFAGVGVGRAVVGGDG
jgi:hypothetical protein